MTDPNDLFDHVHLGGLFSTAYACRICGALVHGNDYQPVSPRQLHTVWHDTLQTVLASSDQPAKES